MEGSPLWHHAVLTILATLSLVLAEVFSLPYLGGVVLWMAIGYYGLLKILLLIVSFIIGIAFFTTRNPAKKNYGGSRFILGFHRNLSGNFSTEAYSIDASLDNWANCTRILLSAWSTGWLIYSFITVFRRNVAGPVCSNPEIHPPLFYLIWIFIQVVRIGGLVLWDWQWILRALALKILVPVSGYVMLLLSYNNLYRHGAWMSVYSPKDVWYIRFMTQNGLALFSTWTSIEALICLGVVLKYSGGILDPLVSTVVLTLVFAGMLMWFVLESFLFEKYMQYTFTVYPMVILGLGAIFTKTYRFDEIAPNTIYCGLLMIVATVLNSIRLVAVCCYADRLSPFLSQDPCPLTDSCKAVCQVEVHDSKGDKFGISNSQFPKDPVAQ